jgi:hypothetical protein
MIAHKLKSKEIPYDWLAFAYWDWSASVRKAAGGKPVLDTLINDATQEAEGGDSDGRKVSNRGRRRVVSIQTVLGSILEG